MRSWPFWRNRDSALPPLMHLTHGKAGSTWIDLILRDLFPGRVAPRLYEFPAKFSFEKHQVYAAIFMTREQFTQFPELAQIKRFVVIRDLRDTLISQYFSMRDTHELDPGGIVEERRPFSARAASRKGCGSCSKRR
jgi:lipopolysaccharide transport system ATP-binding protein